MTNESDWMMERYRLGELDERQKADLESSAGFRERMSALDESDRRILAEYPPSWVTESIRLRVRMRGRRAVIHAAGLMIPLAAAALLIVLTVPWFADRNQSGDMTEVLRPKGVETARPLMSPELLLYRNGPDGIEELRSGDEAREHDLLQVGYAGGDRWYGVILSVDGNGVVTRHWPAEGDRSVPLTGEHLLPYAYELDDAPDFEDFILFWSEVEFPVSDALSAAALYNGDSNQGFPETGGPGRSGSIVIRIRKAP